MITVINMHTGIDILMDMNLRSFWKNMMMY